MARLNLRWKVSFHLIGLTAATILLVAWSINFALDRQFTQYLITLDEQRSGMVAAAVEDIYRDTRSWAVSTPDLARLSAMTNRWIQVMDPQGHVVFDSAVERRGMTMMHGRRVPVQPPRDAYVVSLPIHIDGQLVGQARLGSLVTEQGIFSQEDLEFRATINRSISWAGAAAVILAAVLSVFFSQRLMRPLQALTTAARRMARGELEQHVPVRGHDELAYLAGTFNDMAANLSQLEQLRRKAAADISHELRTPLTTIRGYIEGMRDNVLPTNAANWQAVENDVERLSRLVTDLQDLAQAEAPLWEKEPFNLNDVVYDAVEQVRPLEPTKGLRWEVKAEHDQITVLGRADRMVRVCTNLLANAVKYSPQGGTVRITVGVCENQAELRIVDDGPGIPADQIPFIFERFYRVDTSRTRTTGGSGIGLTIAKEIVHSHGGSIAVDADYQGGACFVVRLPLAEA